jgi:hypothetical protein
MWDLWWPKEHFGKFSLSTSISLANHHSTDCSTITIIYHPGMVQQAKEWMQCQPIRGGGEVKHGKK